MTESAGIFSTHNRYCMRGATRHATWPTASAALGRTMTAAVMMGAMLKGEDKLTVKVEGKGPIGAMIVDAMRKAKFVDMQRIRKLILI